MRPIRYATKELVRAFDARKVLDLTQVKAALGTPVKMTALRQLRQLDYHSSYSHAGRYYTLERIARWDGHGLWSSTGIRFSRHGTLVETMAQLVDAAAGGWVSAELEDVPGVRVYAALLSLYRRGRVRRHQIGGAYLYVSVHDGSAQLAHRQQQVQAEAVSFMGLGLEADLRPHLQAFLATLNEKQRRLYAGFESLRLGRGGDTIVAGWTGLNVKTVARGRQELHSGGVSIDRVRAVGAGRPALKKTHEPNRGAARRRHGRCPMTGLKWSRKSTRSVSKTLAAEGVAASPNTVAACLKRLNFSLQRNRKSIGETRHPQRDQQFRHLSAIKASFEDRGQPVISVDSKKRELVGLFLNPGQTWCWMGREVLTHDFRSQSFGVALPYGIYDPQRNAGTVVVGTSHDTAEFAVDAIEPWLTTYGWYHHPDMRELLILCDTGGSNSAQSHLWKYCLSQRLAHSYSLPVTVCHYPPGASKWNPIDHRLFSFISLNWAGVPLESYALILNYLRTTTTTTGLTVDATLNRKRYDTGKKISTELYRQIEIQHDAILPQWNYTIQPSHPTCLNAN